MSDLLLEIAPGHTVRGFLAHDNTDCLLSVFCVYDFLDAVARLHGPEPHKRGPFSRNLWDNLTSGAPNTLRSLASTAPIRKSFHAMQWLKYPVLTARGLLELLVLVQSHLPHAKASKNIDNTSSVNTKSLWYQILPIDLQDKTLKTMTSEEGLARFGNPETIAAQHDHKDKIISMEEMAQIMSDPVRKVEYITRLEEYRNLKHESKSTSNSTPKINTTLTVTVTETLNRFINGDHSMLQIIGTLPKTYTITKQAKAAIAPRNVILHVSDRIVMGVDYSGTTEPVFSVYAMIDVLGWRLSGQRVAHNYAQNMWEDMKNDKRPNMTPYVMARISCNETSMQRKLTPAMTLSNLRFVCMYVIFKHKESNKYTEISDDVKNTINMLLLKIENRDRSILEYIQ